MSAADFRIEHAQGGAALHAIGDWTALAMGDLAERLQAALGETRSERIDVTRLGHIDTAGTLVLLRSMNAGHDFSASGRDDLKRLRSEEHTSELQSLMRISYAVFCLKKKKKTNKNP